VTLFPQHSRVWRRVARWFLFRPKLLIWVYFGGPWNAKCCFILCPFGIFYSHLVYIFNVHLVILSSFGIFFPRFGILYQEKSGNPGVASLAGLVTFVTFLVQPQSRNSILRRKSFQVSRPDKA
jgi:hypothetical protein